MANIVLNKKLSLCFFLLIICMANLFASDIDVSAYVDENTVGINDTFKLYIEISGSITSSFEQPLLPNIPFQNLGMSQSSSTSISVINGKMTSVKKQIYIYTLKPQNMGTFSIPAITIKIGKDTYKTNGVNITVAEQGTTKQNQPTQRTTQTTNFKTSGQINNEDIVFIAIPSKTSLYKNETFYVDYTIYTRYNLQPTRLGDEPSFNGFWKEDISGNANIEMKETTWNGQKYYSIHLRRLALAPNKTGTLTIPSQTLYADVIIPSNNFFSFADRRSISVQTSPIKITVNELPAPPKGVEFSGAVGDFKISSNLSQTQLKAGESATLTITVSGNGNLRQTNNPVFPDVSNLRVLGPETDTQHNINNEANTAKRVLKYAFLPQDEGFYNIPSIDFTYFNPIKKQYITLQTSEFKLQAERGNIVVSTYSNQKMINAEGSDIGFIVTNLRFSGFKILFKETWYWGLILFSIISIPAHYFYKLEQDKLSNNLEYFRTRKAKRVLKKYLKNTSFAYKHQQNNQFYDSAYKGILQYLTDKLSIPRGSTQTSILSDLREKISDKEQIEKLESFLNKCTEYKYSSSSVDNVDIHNDYFDLKNIVDGLTKQL
ncbi:MAG TPA: BatD family protein [Candidatus Cloacimonadota bacterium]|nr:BatD family protein [Candidatus Cloacimonadota bacterium]